MAKNKLSETRVKSLTEPGIYGDGDGLYLRLYKGGSKSWVFIYRRGTERHELGLGGYGQGTSPVSLALAREKAGIIRGDLARGIDPRRESSPTKPKTFSDCMVGLLAVKASELSNAKHKAQWEMTLREYAKPLHDMPVDQITMPDVKDCLMEYWLAKPETAQRLRSRIQAVIDYAIAHDWRTSANPAQWKGLLDKVMPKRQKLTRGHHTALQYAQAPEMMAGLRRSSGMGARAVEFAALTAARTGEVRGAVWSEIDWAAKVWVCPAERMKAKREHRVPLTARAIEVLEIVRAAATSDYIFGGDHDGKPVSDTAMTKALRLAAPDKACTLHGLRSMFRDWAGNETPHDRETAEAALAHRIGNAVEQAYRREDALDKRRKLMDDWSAYCSSASEHLSTRV